MTFKTYNEFKDAVISEKITLVHLHAKQYLLTFTNYSGDVYVRDVDHVITNVVQNGAILTEVSAIGAIIIGTYFYDMAANKLYVYSTDIGNDKYLVTYRLFFSTAPVNLSYDLNNGDEVSYDSRLKTNVPYSVKTDSSAIGTALIASGKLTLDNTDHLLDGYGKLFFENQEVRVYSYNRDLTDDQIQLIYDGVIVSKTFTEKDMSFKINNRLDFINNLVDLRAYAVADNISSSVSNTYMSRPFGRVDGLQAQSISIIGESFSLIGTISGTSGSTTLTGTGTDFVGQLSPNDILTLSDGKVVTVESVYGSTTLYITDELEDTVTDETALVEPAISSPRYNRTWNISSAALRETVCNITAVPFTNAVELDDIRDIEINDIITLNDGQVRLIDSISGNRIVLSQSFLPLPVVGNTITRLPVQHAYYLGKELDKNKYTVTNSTSGCQLLLDEDMEESHFIAKAIDTSATYSISSGNRIINRDSGTNEQLPELIKPRDYIQIGNSAFYEVLQVSASTITIRTNIATSHTNDMIRVKNVEVINDDSVISVDVLGETVDGETDGVWIKNSSQFVKKLLVEQGLSGIINSDSFDNTSNSMDFTVSVVIPTSPSSDKSESIKKILNKVTQSTFTSLTINSNMELVYQSVEAAVDYNNLITIGEFDVITWKSKTEQNILFEKIITAYKAKQVNTISESSSHSFVEFINALAGDLGINKINEFDVVLYKESEAYSMAQRRAMMTQNLNTVVEITSDLRLSSVELGDTVIVDLDTVSNFGDLSTNKRLMVVTAIKRDGEKISMSLSDLSNLFAKRAVITENTAVDYIATTVDEKLINSYITIDNGTIENDDSTYGRNIII